MTGLDRFLSSERPIAEAAAGQAAMENAVKEQVARENAGEKEKADKAKTTATAAMAQRPKTAARPLSLSPSSISLFIECPRCFWLDRVKGVKRPSGPFSSLPNGMDRVLKRHFDLHRGDNTPPEELEGRFRGRLFQDIEKLKVWRNNTARFPFRLVGQTVRVLPGADRAFAFQSWPAFRPAAFEHLKRELAAAAVAAPKRILTSDVDPAAVETARRNLGDHPVVVRDFLDWLPPPEDERRLYALNPPYGKRQRGADPRRLYGRIGEVIRSDPGAGYAIIVPGLELEKVLSLPRDRKILFQNGGIRVAAILRRSC